MIRDGLLGKVLLPVCVVAALWSAGLVGALVQRVVYAETLIPVVEGAQDAACAATDAAIEAREDIRGLTARIEALEASVTALDAAASKKVDRKASAKPTASSGWATARASWYGPGFYGNRTASGVVYTPTLLCVAHKTLPFGTKVEVEYGGKRLVLPVLDRGPYVAGREFDLSAAAAKTLGFSGVRTIRYRVVR